jgi:hypothetical protein
LILPTKKWNDCELAEALSSHTTTRADGNTLLRVLLRAGSSFSDADVEFACRVELIEMRVVTPTRCYFLRPAISGWNRNYWEDVLKPVYTRCEAEIKRQFRLCVLRRQMSWEEAGAEEMHEIWSRVAAELGLTYAREQE